MMEIPDKHEVGPGVLFDARLRGTWRKWVEIF